MGSVIYRKVNNVFEIPPDILVECIGKGLIVARKCDSERDENPKDAPCSLEVNTGDGIGFDDQGRITIKDGDGVYFNNDGKLCVHIAKHGDGLKLNEDNALVVNVDENSALVIVDGQLSIDESKLHINIPQCPEVAVEDNGGLKLDNGKLSIDTQVVDPVRVITNLTDISLNFCAFSNKLTLTKKFTDYNVKKNNVGVVVDIQVGEIHECQEEITLSCSEGYGGGYGGGYDGGYGGYGCDNDPKPARMTMPFQPNFYQK